uniref:Serine-threonine/tyrosine-protein kinase catalytic domain-containing protein n=1 Tax=Leersia perrieri TaxID=77586 RepID=A0A0D9WED1_9ORYZ
MALEAEELVEPPDDDEEFTEVPYKSTDRWEIDFSKLETPDADKIEVKRGLHGMLYRSKYGGSDVAVKFLEWGALTPDEIGHKRSLLREVANQWELLCYPNIAKFYGASIGTTDVDILENLDRSISSSACCVLSIG